MSDYSRILMIHGKDAYTFLSGQITTHLPRPGQGRYSLLLDHQGRIISDFIIVCHDHNHFLLCLKDSVFMATVYALQHKITGAAVMLAESKELFSGTALNLPTEVWGIPDPRHHRLGYRLISTQPLIQDSDYLQRRLVLALPETEELTVGKALPAEFGVDQLAIDFDKGCFTGQEVCARLRYLGQAKFRVVALRFIGALQPDQPLYVAEEKVGSVVSVYAPAASTPVQYTFVRLRTETRIARLQTQNAQLQFHEVLDRPWLPAMK